jgi:hypothetical protein
MTREDTERHVGTACGCGQQAADAEGTHVPDADPR